MDTYQQALDEQVRIAGLLEDNHDYSYLTSVMPLFDEDDNTIGFAVGVGWYTIRLDDVGDHHEYGNMMAITDVGAPIEAIKRALHHSYTATMADLD